jgi:lysine-N-methylase
MESIRPDPAAQLEMVLRLVGLRTGSLELSPRLTECVRAVADGIGWRAGVPLAEQVARYESSHREFYAPFFDRHPHILENYLLNQMLRQVFPFGIKLFEASAVPEFAQTFAELAIQFALTKGLLIGVAGFYRERFSIDHVVQVVQSISRHFEHSPKFLADAAALLHERKMDNAQGLAMLLRN